VLNKKGQRKEVRPTYIHFIFDFTIEVVEVADFFSSFPKDVGTVCVDLDWGFNFIEVTLCLVSME
jgi:hypothetical protein